MYLTSHMHKESVFGTGHVFLYLQSVTRELTVSSQNLLADLVT